MPSTVSRLPAVSTERGWLLTGRLSEDGDSRAVPLEPLPFQVGRKPGLSLTLPRRTVSGLHAEFFRTGGRLHLTDLDSTNGTFVNGERLTGTRELHENDLVQFADAPFRLSRSEDLAQSRTRCQDACDRALAIVQFESLRAGNGLVPHFQPICDLLTGDLAAYEALARGRLLGLETPEYMFEAAAQLGATAELSRVIRRVSVEASGLFPDLPHLFLNTHPSETGTGELLESCAELRRSAPAQKLTIEIHEAALSRADEMLDLRHRLSDLGMTLAFDDFGAGQARIAELAEVRPDYLKFDRSMVRQLDAADAARRRVVGGLVSMARDVGIVTLAEGIETPEEREACLDLGFELVQGFLIGRPMPAVHYLQASRA
jgi:EAL domain-containing protein (putative c-di-GMP-specific phosphodiesterase class I)